MKDVIKWYLLIPVCVGLVINGCKEEESVSRRYNVQGKVQKGPFVLGTTIIVSEQTASLNQTGNSYTTEISDNTGSFDIPDVTLTSNYVQLSANGFYFDEVKGKISDAPLSLNALSDLTDQTTVNVNVLTHLEKRRVEYLVSHGTTFAQAKQTAQQEVLNVFGITTSQIGSSESLDITLMDERGAILLAVSLILQGDLTVGQLTEQLAVIAQDLEDDGILDNDGVLPWLRYQAVRLPVDIREKLETRYQEIGLTAGVPDFEHHIETFLAFTGAAPVSGILPAENVTALGATLRAVIGPNSLPTTVTFEYGTTTDYGSTVTAVESPVNSKGSVQVSAPVTLSPNTTYHFRVKSENSKGTSVSDDATFTTPGGIPQLTVRQPSIEPTQVGLNAVVNPNDLETIVTFEYGPTESYGSVVTATVPAGSSEVTIVELISGLTLGQTYYYRVKAENQLGNAVSEAHTFIPFHPIGSSFQGGLLAYVLQPGDLGFEDGIPHGLIIAPKNFTALMTLAPPFGQGINDYPWSWGPDNLFIGETSTAIGTGKLNTEKFAAALPSANYPAVISDKMELNGYQDWFLPSLEEMTIAVENSTVLELDESSRYWTSSEESIDKAWNVHVYNILQNAHWKATLNSFRPMRYF